VLEAAAWPARDGKVAGHGETSCLFATVTGIGASADREGVYQAFACTPCCSVEGEQAKSAPTGRGPMQSSLVGACPPFPPISSHPPPSV
jgi:hypothetical protein